jgi:signal peptidase I
LYDVVPQVPVDGLVIFETPQVRIEDFVKFPAPDVRLDELTFYNTEGVHVRNKLWEWTESLASTVIFVLVFTALIAQATQVPTESMKPTIMVGDHFFLDKVAFPGNFPERIQPWLPKRGIQRGDIIAFRAPVDPEIPFVKRVIGVGGDTVEIRDKILFLNGKAQDEPYKIHTDLTIHKLESEPQELAIRDNFGPTTIPAGEFFVMGDNRDNSNDSRFWGTVKWNTIIGKPLFVYWSYESDPYIAGDRSWTDLSREYLSIAIHFFSRTRWFRMGTSVE